MNGDWAETFLDVAYDDVPAPLREREAARSLHRDFLKLVETVDAERPWKAPMATRSTQKQSKPGCATAPIPISPTPSCDGMNELGVREDLKQGCINPASGPNAESVSPSGGTKNLAAAWNCRTDSTTFSQQAQGRNSHQRCCPVGASRR